MNFYGVSTGSAQITQPFNPHTNIPGILPNNIVNHAVNTHAGTIMNQGNNAFEQSLLNNGSLAHSSMNQQGNYNGKTQVNQGNWNANNGQKNYERKKGNFYKGSRRY